MPLADANSVAPLPTRRLGGTRRRLRGFAEASRIRRANEMGFLISLQSQCWIKARCRLTSNGTTRSTAAKMIDDDSVTFHLAMYGEVAAIACIRHLAVLEDLDSNLDGVGSTTSSSQDSHARPGSTAVMLVEMAAVKGCLLDAGRQMEVLILDTVVARPGMDEYTGVLDSAGLFVVKHFRCGTGCLIAGVSW